MNIILRSILVLTSLLWLGSCATVNRSSESSDEVDENLHTISSLHFDFTPEIPNVTYRVFRATKQGRAGWMNVEGDWIIPAEYDTEFRREWSEGINICRKDGKHGAVNYRNEIVVPFVYDTPPVDCSNGLILVTNDAGLVAYFSKTGVQMTDFNESQPTFQNGLAIIRSGYEAFENYPRLDLDKPNRTTTIYRGDFVVINTEFDTLLSFSDVPFLLKFGSLNNNRRSFFMYPHMASHADLGISYGQYGYLNARGNLVIEPTFRAMDVFTRILGGVVREADCPFYSNRSLLREGENYAYIDTLGRKVIEIESDQVEVYDVSNFNHFGIAGYRTMGSTPQSNRIHLINSEGEVLHDALEREAPMALQPMNISHQPLNHFIPMFDRVNAQLRLYTPSFELFSELPLHGSSDTVKYGYDVSSEVQLNVRFRAVQLRLGSRGEFKRLVDQQGEPASSWLPPSSLISLNFGNFSLSQANASGVAIYDAQKNLIYECDSCEIYDDQQIGDNGLYKLYGSDGNLIFVNFRGRVLSDLFDDLDQRIVDLSDQVANYENSWSVQINTTESEFIELFEESEMSERIIR